MRRLLLQVGLVGLGGAAGWGMQQEMGVVKQAAKARPQRVDRPELAVPHGTPGYHLRTRGEWIKRSYGEHSDAHHRQRYSHGAPPSDAAMGPRARRRAQTTVTKVLTAENTAPLQIAVDFSGMYSEATEHAPSFAQPYTGCFAEGDWFKWNYPESSSPPCTNTCAECKAAGAGSCDTACVFPGSTAPCGGSDAVDTRTFSPTNPDGVLCNRQYDPSAQDCWGVCLREDVITDEIRTFMKSEVESVVAEVEALFRVRQRAGNMVLANSKGVYSRLYESMEGVETDAECAKDARVLYRMPVADSYCTAGVDADVIFMPFMAQHVPNVAGFGGDAGKDQYGRPVLITMGWGMGGWGTTTGQQNLRATARAVIMHELVHGLGFNIFVFQNTYGYDGWSRTIVRQMPVQDTDGTTDSSVWHAVGERVIAVARAYFQCNETEWPGMALPLMGENPLGDTSRGSHWETRIMKDEFLAYGGGDVVSAFTLAMMEDLGHYIGDYSRVGQMSWGRGQGCSFIYWRCGDRADDYTKTTAVAVSASAECHATHSYGSSTGPLAAQLTRKCLRPPGVVDGVVKRCAQVDWTACCDSKCNSECVTNPATTLPPDHPTLVVPPIGDGIPAAGEKYSPSITSGSSTVVLGFGGSILLMLLLALFVSLYLHLDHYLCILRLSMTISVIFVGFGCGVVGVCIYVLNDAIIIKFVSRDLVIAGLIGGIIFSLLALLGLWGATRTHTHGTGYVMTIYWMIMFTVLVAEIFIIFSLVVWIDDVSQASTDTSQQFESSIVARTRDSDSAAEGEGSLVGNVVTEIEGFACRTYKSCCWTYAPNQTACTQTHAGSSVGSAAAAQQDPSAPNFCAQVTGSKTTDDGSADMLCNTLSESLVDGKPVVDLQTCAAEFCDAGVEGYEDFVAALVGWVQTELIPVAYVLGAFVVLQMAQLVLSGRLIALAHYFKDEVEELHREHAKQAQVVLRKARPRYGSKKVVVAQAEQAPGSNLTEVRGDKDIIGVWRALHAYASTAPPEEGELPDLQFQKGDEIHVTDDEGDWWSGWNATAESAAGAGTPAVARRTVGQFPSNYLEPTPVSLSKGTGSSLSPLSGGLKSTMSVESVGQLESPLSHNRLPPMQESKLAVVGSTQPQP